MARILVEGTCCECCALVIANGDDSGCRDYYGHTHPAPTVPARMARQAAEGYAETYGQPPADGIAWEAWLVLSGEADADGDSSEEFVGPCPLCGNGPDGYMSGEPFAIVR